jgi:phytoene dehydrogenase-like protein
MSRSDYDVAIVGAGPNGLTAAAYLARAGARVVVLDKRFERGGTFATDDYSTPYQYNVAQFELPLGRELPPYRDFDLRAQAIRFLEPKFPFSVQTEPRGREFLVGRGGRGLGGELEEMFAAVSEAVTPWLYAPPRDEHAVLAELEAGNGLAAAAAATPRTLAARAGDARGAIAVRYACGLAGFLDGNTRLGLVGAFAVARLFSPAIVAGGTKNLANAIARVAAGAGARGFVSSEVTRIARDGERLRLWIAGGRDLRAGAVVSTLDPKSTFLGLLDDDLVHAELRDAAERWVVEETGPYTAHYGIKGEPPLPAGGDGADALTRIFGFPRPEDVEERFQTVLRGELPRAIAGHLTVVSAHDPLQASPGPYGPLHTLRLQTMVPFRHPEGPWDRARAAFRAACWDAAVGHFEGLDHARLLFQFSDTPRDIEGRFGTCRRGSIRQGALLPGQTLTGRPHPSCSSGRIPVPGLYMGGGGVHPGVPGCLGGGYRAAGLVAEDRGLARSLPA